MSCFMTFRQGRDHPRSQNVTCSCQHRSANHTSSATEESKTSSNCSSMPLIKLILRKKKKKHARSTETEGSERRPREFRRSSSVDVVRKTFGPSTEDDEMTRALKFDSQRSSRPQACKHAKLSEAQQQGYKKKNTLGGLLRGLYICCTNLSSCSLRINLANGAIPTKNWKSGRRPSH